MTRFPRAATATLAALAAASPLAAQAGAPVARDTVRLDSLTVTATRIPLAPSGVTVSQTVITGAELRERGIRFLLDALRDTPGAQVVQVGSFGGQTSLFLRGGNSNFVKVLVDGVPLNLPGGGFDFAHLTADNIERVEIVRGPASVVHGADAVTGVVQVFTRRGQGPVRATASALGGTFGTAMWDAGVQGGDERLAYSAQVARVTTDGILPFNNAYRNTVVSGRVAGRFDDQSDAAVALRYTDNRSRFPTDFAGVPRDSNQFTFQEGLTLGAEGGRRLRPDVEVRASLAANLVDNGFQNDPDFPGDTLRSGFRSRSLAAVSRRGADLRVNWTAARGVVVTGGAQWEFESIRQNDQRTSLSAGRQATTASAFDAARDTRGYYAQAVADLAGGLAANAGVRVDENSAFGTFLTFRGGVAYAFATGTRLRASAGRAFRAPTFPEQFAQSAFEVGNPDLTPERSTAWEVGATQALWRGRVSLEATWFDQRFRDLIQYSFQAAGRPTYFNVAGASARGLEVGVTARPLDAVQVQAQYTRLFTEVTDVGLGSSTSPSFPLGGALLRRPGHQWRVAGRWRAVDRATLGANVLRVGGRADVDFRPFPALRTDLPGYTLVDLTLDADVTRPAPGQPGLGLQARVENLFDERYESVLAFPGRGRAVFAGARVTF